MQSHFTTRVTQIAEARSLLFVPGDRPERFGKACASGADAVILDLEDAVRPENKERARSCVREWLAQPSSGVRPLVLVRINGIDFKEIDEELTLVASHAVDGVILPKAQTARDIDWFHRVLPLQPLLPLIETAQGLCAIDEVARAPGVARLVFGSVDLMLDLNVSDEAGLDVHRAQTVLRSRVFGLPAPIDGVTREIADLQALAGAASRAKAWGWGGKLCIHPCQVEVVNRAFHPSSEELIRATRIVEAAQASGAGAILVDGQMVDAPVVLQARRVLADARARSRVPSIRQEGAL